MSAPNTPPKRPERARRPHPDGPPSRPDSPSQPPRPSRPERLSRLNGGALTPLRPSSPDPSASSTALPAPLTRTKAQDPAIDRALQLSTFENDYSVEEFISTLSEKLIDESKASSGAFDPKPFLQTFSPALDSLLSLRSQVAERVKKMETDVRRAEREYGRRLRELDGGFEAIGSSFSNLESKITDVGQTAVRIGEQLESLHQTRSTAQSTSLLLSYYLSLVHQTSTTPDPNDPAAPPNPLEGLFATRTSRDGRARIAVILRRLMAVAKDVADNAATALNDAEEAASSKEGEPDGSAGAALKTVVKRRKDKEKADRVRDEVERYCERFEKEVLRLFDRSYRKGDPRMMAHCAKTLQDFNGGASCVQIYVNQHDFFISKDRVLEEAMKDQTVMGEDGKAVKKDIWVTIGDPDAAPPATEAGMEALFKEIRVTVSQEAQIVKAVFPNPSAVMQVFLQRVFAQVIQQHLESLVSRASGISTLAVLRVLNMVHSNCATLVEDLKTYDSVLSNTTTGPSKGPLSSSTTSGSTTGPLAAMLDHALEEIFVPWLEGTRYLESETKNLVEMYAGLLARFTRYHETVLKAKPNSLLDKVVNQLSSSSSNSTSSSTAHAAAAAVSRYANIFSTATERATKALGNSTAPATAQHSPTMNKSHQTMLPNTAQGRPEPRRQETLDRQALTKGIDEKVWSTDGVLTVEMAERMLKWHAEAVGRIVELSGTGDVPKNAFALSKTLAEALGRSFIETALDSAIARYEQQDSKAEPDLQPLTVLKPADLIFHLWQKYSQTALSPLAGNTAAIRREMTSFNAHSVVRMEGRINSVIQKTLDVILAWIAQLLTKQKKNDYKPKNDELSFARTTTEPCELICDFLGTVKDAVNEGLSGKNKEAFLTELGVAFHSQLLDHYKKFPVNPTGGLMLTKDLASYQEAMSVFSLPAINDRFDMLRQLGNSFIVQPNVLKSYMTESHLGRIELRLLKPYLAQRSDYPTFSRSLNLDDGPEDQTSANGSPSLNFGFAGGHTAHGHGHGFSLGLGPKGSRFSAMSGVAGAGMGKLREMLKEFEGESEEERKVRLEKWKAWEEKNPGKAQAVYRPSPYGGMPMYFGH